MIIQLIEFIILAIGIIDENGIFLDDFNYFKRNHDYKIFLILITLY